MPENRLPEHGMDARSIRERFAVSDEVVSALPGAVGATSQEQYRAWRETLDPGARPVIEHLLPRIRREVGDQWPPPFMKRRAGHLDLSTEALQQAVTALGPWGVPFRFGDGIEVMPGGMVEAVAARRYQFRRDLIGATLAELLGDDLARTSVLDIGCNCGLFSLDLADRGAGHVLGVDLRPANIAQAHFAAEHYGVERVDFEVHDVDAVGSAEQYDVVLNLGVLYHVVNPLQFVRQTYELCRRFAIIDTVCHLEPVSAYFLMGDKDVNRVTEGREVYELHPTYRAVIDTIRYAGFTDVFEIEGVAARPHDLYASGVRRCFLAIK